MYSALISSAPTLLRMGVLLESPFLISCLIIHHYSCPDIQWSNAAFIVTRAKCKHTVKFLQTVKSSIAISTSPISKLYRNSRLSPHARGTMCWRHLQSPVRALLLWMYGPNQRPLLAHPPFFPHGASRSRPEECGKAGASFLSSLLTHHVHHCHWLHPLGGTGRGWFGGFTLPGRSLPGPTSRGPATPCRRWFAGSCGWPGGGTGSVATPCRPRLVKSCIWLRATGSIVPPVGHDTL